MSPTPPEPLRTALHCHQAGRLDEAAQAYGQAIRQAEADHDPETLFAASCNLAALLSTRDRWGEAEALFRKALALVPEHPDLHYSLAYTLQRQERLDDAEQAYRRTLALKPDHAMAAHNLGLMLRTRAPEAAESVYRQALAANPGLLECWLDLTGLLRGQGRLDEAEQACRQALAIAPGHAGALTEMGDLMRLRDRHEEAIPAYRQALATPPGPPDTWNRLGIALRAAGRLGEAEAAFRQALALNPGHVGAINNLGALLQDRNRHGEAETLLLKALALDPGLSALHNNLGTLYRALGRPEAAEQSFLQAIALDPDNADALANSGQLYRDLGRLPEAESAFRRAWERAPDHPSAYGDWLFVRRRLCQWDIPSGAPGGGLDQAAGRIDPFAALSLADAPDRHREAASRSAAKAATGAGAPLWQGERYRHDRIRVAYLSADLHDHATAYLMAELFETHDRDRFEILAVSWGPDQPSAMRTRMKRAFDRFEDVADLDDEAVARRLRELEVDIAVDLKGYTKDSRPGILARRPAPVQVNYLGYPGTMAADWIDYILADVTVIPEEAFAHYQESIVRLPDCYQVNDRHRSLPEAPSRSACGLPDQGFVFCDFNNSYKITPDLFAVWMRLLEGVPGSVLWLLEDNRWARDNLRREAERAGIDPARLVFAPRAPLPEHLARHRLADLFVDTFPYSAHTTASDALWAGLPVLTLMGRSFASRVAASLLRSVGLPELVTRNLAEYEARALELARDPAALAALRARLGTRKTDSPLFDTDRARRHIEAAYETMWRRTQAGLPPTHFDVPVQERASSNH